MAYFNIFQKKWPETATLVPLEVPVELRSAAVENVAAPVEPVLAPVDKGCWYTCQADICHPIFCDICQGIFVTFAKTFFRTSAKRTFANPLKKSESVPKCFRWDGGCHGRVVGRVGQQGSE